MSPRPPLLRPLAHAATACLALLLGVLPDPYDLVIAGLGILAGFVIFPLTPIERMLRRPDEPFFGGLRTYPIAVLLLVLFLPRAEAAAAWGVLGFGDAAASLVGPRVKAPAVFGHRKATWSGSGAYVLLGAAAAYALGHGVAALGAGPGAIETGPAPDLARCALAALAAAASDLVPLPPDDNMPGALAAGVVLRLTRGT